MAGSLILIIPESVLVSPNDLPRFWIFMYYASPLTYFLEGLAIAGVAGTRVFCSGVEMLHTDVPPSFSPSAAGRTCGDYLGPYARATGGYVANPDAAADCRFCQVSEADTVLRTLGMDPRAAVAWRNVGIMAAYVVFNVAATFGVYWLVRGSRTKKKGKAAQE